MKEKAASKAAPVLPERLARRLKTGETVYHSTAACHVSGKYPDGKWIAQVRRMEGGRLAKYPVKGFGSAREAIEYAESLRPDTRGRVASPRQGEATVGDLYEYVRKHKQKRLSERTKGEKETRWRLHIQAYWGDWALSTVTSRAAQEWISETEERIARGEAGSLGLGQFDKVRTDLSALFGALGSFSEDFEDKRNPFIGLDFSAAPPRARVTIESRWFAPISHACRGLARVGLCTEWMCETFLTALLAGLRQGEVLALCRDQIDFERGAIVVDRALRRKAREIDPGSRIEGGSVLPQAMSYPKGGVWGREKIRTVPMSDQLADVLRRRYDAGGRPSGVWDLLWPTESGNLRQLTRFATAWATLRGRLNELAKAAPAFHEGGPWPTYRPGQGVAANPLVPLLRGDASLRLPDVFGSIDFRDTRNSFASYINEVGVPQATRESVLGHVGGLTNETYTDVTSAAFQEARRRLSAGWSILV